MTSPFAIQGNLDGGEHIEVINQDLYIGLHSGSEEFLLPVSKISEIILLPAITKVPNAPDRIEGVVNLRGTILPIANLAKVFHGEERPYPKDSRLVITKSDKHELGLIVDSITETKSFAPHQLTPNNSGLIGMFAREGERVMGILDLEQVFMRITDAEHASPSTSPIALET